MSRTILLVLIIYGLLIVGLAGLQGEFIGMALPFVIYMLAGFWRSPDKFDLEAHRTLSNERVSPDQEIVVKVEVTNRGTSLDELLVEDVVPPNLMVRDGSPRHLLRLKTGESYSWSYTVSGPRGSHPFERIKAEANDPFGIWRRRQEIEERSELFIFPPLTKLKNVTIRPRNTRVYSGLIPARVGGPGVEFFGLREYQPSDPPRWINWRASARHRNALYSNEFQQERVADVGIVLDGRESTNRMHDQYVLFEHSVLAAAALADAFLTQGNRVGLLNYSPYINWTMPGYGKLQRERIMQVLSRAEPGGSAVFAGLEHIPTKLFPAHSQLVLVSPLDSSDLDVLVQLRARGYQVMVISPDPVSYELGQLPKTHEVELAGRVLRMERALLLRNLQRAGVQVLDWDVSLPFDQVIRSRLGPPPALLNAIGGLA
jgi:uncharacterized protein (DUF58 family)